MAEKIYKWVDNPTSSEGSVYEVDVLNDSLMHLKYDKTPKDYEEMKKEMEDLKSRVCTLESEKADCSREITRLKKHLHKHKEDENG